MFYQKLPEKAGELDRAAPPANECHVCGEDFKFLSVMDRWFEEKVILFSERVYPGISITNDIIMRWLSGLTKTLIWLELRKR